MKKSVKDKSKFFKKGWFWLGILLILIISFSLVYIRVNTYNKNVKDCGNYSYYIGKNNENKTQEKSKEITCFEDAFQTCTEAVIYEYSSDWEGGTHTSNYKVIKDNDSCKIKVDSATEAWYIPGGKGQSTLICSSFEIENNKIILKDCK